LTCGFFARKKTVSCLSSLSVPKLGIAVGGKLALVIDYIKSQIFGTNPVRFASHTHTHTFQSLPLYNITHTLRIV
jgi:hypothetical protein